MNNSNNIKKLAKNSVKKFTVYKRECGEEYYPIRIPRNRDDRTFYILLAIACICILGSIFASENSFLDIIIAYSILLNIHFVLEFVQRVVLFVEEKKHFASRYNEDWKKLSFHVFHFQTITLFTFISSLFSLILARFTLGPSALGKLTEIDTISLTLIICCSILHVQLLNLKNAPIYKALKIAENDGLNYGSGMAHSFFHGYLELILPKTGNAEKNVKEFIENYEDREGVRFPLSRLFILIPKSCICHVSLKDDKFPNVEESSSLEEKIKDVAGVKGRVYKNAVYKIKNVKQNKRIYVCVEYATPLRTFYETLKHDSEYTKYYKDHKDEIVLQFYLTLKWIFEKYVEYKEHCELIYYDDMTPDGEFCDVAAIILNRIKHIEMKKKKSE